MFHIFFRQWVTLHQIAVNVFSEGFAFLRPRFWRALIEGVLVEFTVDSVIRVVKVASELYPLTFTDRQLESSVPLVDGTIPRGVEILSAASCEVWISSCNLESVASFVSFWISGIESLEGVTWLVDVTDVVDQ